MPERFYAVRNRDTLKTLAVKKCPFVDARHTFRDRDVLKWWQLILSFAGIMLIISGPAMIMAWMKLRRRNIAPLLNANGWAINAASKISIPFGNTLTDIAKYPKMRLKDPYAKKGMPVWASILLTVVTILAFVAGIVVYLTLCKGYSMNDFFTF